MVLVRHWQAPCWPKAKAVVLTGRLLYPLTARQQRRTASNGDIVSGQTLKIGTRKSVMALAQTEGIARLLRASDPALDVEIVKFETRGDQDQTSKLLRHGGKGGAFVAEIREAMRAGQLQAAMHSLKDVPGNEETPGLIIAAMLPRDPDSNGSEWLHESSMISRFAKCCRRWGRASSRSNAWRGIGLRAGAWRR